MVKSLVIAVLVMAGSLTVLVPSPAAATTIPESATGSLQILRAGSYVGPGDGSAGDITDLERQVTQITARRAYEDPLGTQQAIRVFNRSGGTCAAVDTLAFVVTHGGGTKSIDFIQNRSSGFGWVSEADNTGSQLVTPAPNRLDFKRAPGSGSFASGTSTDLILGFTVTGNPTSGSLFTVTVKGLVNGSQTCVTQFSILIDDRTPVVQTTGAAAPCYVDENHNGHVDAAYITWDEEMDLKTFSTTDFNFNSDASGDYAIRRIDTRNIADLEYPDPPNPEVHMDCGDPTGDRSIPITVMTPATATPTGFYTQAKFSFTEKTVYDTGVRMKVTYTPGALSDIAGKPYPSKTLTVVDRARPVIVAAAPMDLTEVNPTGTYDGVLVTFSEKPIADPVAANFDILGDVTTSHVVIDVDDTERDEAFTLKLDNPIAIAELDDSLPASSRPQVTLVSAGATACPARLANGPDFDDESPCANLRDVASNPFKIPDPSLASEIRFIRTPRVFYDITNPGQADIAEVNINQRIVTLKFNGPVAGPDSDDENLDENDFDLIETADGGPQGIEVNGVEHIAGTDTVRITLDAPIKPTDVDDSPATIRIPAHTVRAWGTGVVDPTYLDAVTVKLRDLTLPAITFANSVDGNNDGIVDGMFLKFNEPIDDSSFCKIDGNAPLAQCDVPEVRVVDPKAIGDPCTNPAASGICFSPPYTWDTDEFEDDDMGVLKFAETRDNIEQTLLERNTAVLPDIIVDGVGLFSDFSRLRVGAQPGDGLAMDVITSTSLVEFDGAAPIVISAWTQDSEAFVPGQDNEVCIVGAPSASSRPDCVEDPDGFLDSYRVTFSEPVKDSTFTHTEWAVADRNVTAGDAATLRGFRYGDLTNDAVLIVPFDETKDADFENGDTASKPQLTYVKATGLEDLAVIPAGSDHVKNVLDDLEIQDVTEKDRARPVITRVEGFVGQSTFKVTFSEGVDDGFSRPLTASDFTYFNAPGTLGPTSFGGADVIHKTGDATAVITVNKALTAGDINATTGDRIAARADYPFPGTDNTLETSHHCDPDTYESGITADCPHTDDAIHEFARGVTFKLSVLPTLKPLSLAPDTTNPGAITAIGVVAGRTEADSVTISWTASGDDGDANGAVDKYVIKVSTAPFASSAVTITDDKPEGVTPNFEPAELVGPGQFQSLVLTGLQPGTTYYISVRALDEKSNPSPATEPLSVATLEDVTPPTGALTPRVAGKAACSGGTRIFEAAPDFAWDAATDSDVSVVKYRYALNKDPDTQLGAETTNITTETTVADIAVPSIGTWYFHVAAVSGATGPTEHCRYVYDYAKIETIAIQDANAALNDDAGAGGSVEVRRRGGSNIINWTLPPEADLPGTLAGLKIWVYEDDQYFPLQNLTGSYSQLAVGNFTDANGDAGDRYLVTMVFATGQQDAQPTTEEYPPVKVSNPNKSLPTWVWLLIGAAAALIIAGIIIYFVLRGKQTAEAAASGVAYSWEETGAPAGTDPASGLPTHDVKCPSCATAFQAVGNMPLQITCPQCGTSGMLQ